MLQNASAKTKDVKIDSTQGNLLHQEKTVCFILTLQKLIKT